MLCGFRCFFSFIRGKNITLIGKNAGIPKCESLFIWRQHGWLDHIVRITSDKMSHQIFIASENMASRVLVDGESLQHNIRCITVYTCTIHRQSTIHLFLLYATYLNLNMIVLRVFVAIADNRIQHHCNYLWTLHICPSCNAEYLTRICRHRDIKTFE